MGNLRFCEAKCCRKTTSNLLGAPLKLYLLSVSTRGVFARSLWSWHKLYGYTRKAVKVFRGVGRFCKKAPQSK